MQKEQTFISIKNEAIQKGLIGEIIHRLERVGLKLVAIKMVVPDKDAIAKQYPDKEWWYKQVGEKTKDSRQKRGVEDNRDIIEIGKWVRGMLLEDLVGKPQVAMVWEGAHAVEITLNLSGKSSFKNPM
ncbi:hypothetical protein L6255_02550 [Candidatus Parcubacteria bacterium]|nr:hypothetical protein [Patescibacteria group bacterium]MBU4380985.1 hypothetical protein [Patescibacteria group bacterium]MCG2689297.1 hypothetical protein [Candidatus Parcubacteria bacterium]